MAGAPTYVHGASYMTDCTRCGTPTSRPALSYSVGREVDPLKDFVSRFDEETNGVIWLCDGCIEAFKSFLIGRAVDGERIDG